VSDKSGIEWTDATWGPVRDEDALARFTERVEIDDQQEPA